MNNQPSATQTAIYNMIAENTGRHFLDSGGAYGRHFERNARRTVEDFINEPEATLRADIRNDRLELDVTLSLFHHLDDNLNFDPDLNELWLRFDEHYPDNTWDGDKGTMEMFAAWARKHSSKYHYNYDLDGEWYSGYTYNEENYLSQDYVYYVMGSWVFIQSHNGCDARGGFSRPVLFTLKDESLRGYDSYIISCDNGHWWDFNHNDEETEQPVYLTEGRYNRKPTCTAVDGLSAEYQSREAEEVATVKQAQAQIKAWELSEPLPGMDKPRCVMPPISEGGVVVVIDEDAYCPICGDKLKAYRSY